MAGPKHGAHGQRQWRKVHLAMDPATSDTRVVEFTPSRDGDSPVRPGLLGQIPADEQIGTVTVDGAWDPRRGHTAVIARVAIPIIPLRRNGRTGKADHPTAKVRRHPALRPSGPETLARLPRPKWDRGADALPEILRRPHQTVRHCRSDHWRDMADRQTAEFRIRIAPMNRLNALGTAEIIRGAWAQGGKGAVTFREGVLPQSHVG